MPRYDPIQIKASQVHFPRHTCISLNGSIAHGIPDDTVIRVGDLVNIDVCAEEDGDVADAGQSFQIPPFANEIKRLCEHSYDATMNVIAKLKHGVLINEIAQLMRC